MIYGENQKVVGPTRVQINMHRNIFEMGLKPETISQYMRTVIERNKKEVSFRKVEKSLGGGAEGQVKWKKREGPIIKVGEGYTKSLVRKENPMRVHSPVPMDRLRFDRVTPVKKNKDDSDFNPRPVVSKRQIAQDSTINK